MSSSKSGKHLVRDILLVVAVIAALDVAVVYLRVLPNPAATAAASCRDSQALAIVSDLLAMGSDPARTSRLAGATARTGARQLMPMGQAHYQFVHFSAYRESFTTFFVIGLSSRLTRDFDKPVHACLWLPPGHPPGSAAELNTTAVLEFVKCDEHVVPYGVVVVKCQFPVQVGADDLGGNLSLTVSAGPPVGKVQRHEVFEEKAGTNFGATKAGPIPHKYGFCSPPIQGSIHQDWVRHWLVYHLSIMDGHAHFFFYNAGGITQEGRAMLDPFVKAGIVTITNVIDDQLYPTWYRAQVLVVNDCLHRTRFLSQWTLFFDFDEFIYLQPPHTLAGLLEANANASVLTLGSWPVGTSHCRPPKSQDEWPVERMVFKKQPGPECKKPEEFSRWLCPHQAGRRKMVLNPRKVFAAAVHRAVHPLGQELHLNASVIRLNHFRGMLAATATPCPVTWNLSRVDPQVYSGVYVQPEEALSEAIARARLSVPRLYLT